MFIERHCLKKGIVGQNGTTPSKDFAGILINFGLRV